MGVEMTNEIKKDEIYLDEKFPKGKIKFRVEAMVLLAFARDVGKLQAKKEFLEFLKNLDCLTPERNIQIENKIKQLSDEENEKKEDDNI